MASAISVIMMILIGLVGGVPTLAITACIPVMIVWKIYRMGHSMSFKFAMMALRRISWISFCLSTP